MPPVQLPTTARMQPFVPIHRSPFPHLIPNPPAASHTPGIHPSGTTWPPAAFRKAAEKSPRHGRQPQNWPTRSRPPLLPPQSRPTNPAGVHAAAPADKSTSHQTQSPPPAGLPLRPQYALRPDDASGTGQRAPLFSPLADRLDTAHKDARNGAQRTALLIHR